MTHAQLTIIAEAARSSAEQIVRDLQAHDDISDAHREANARDCAQDVYDATMAAGRQFVRPLTPIYEVD